MNTKLRDFMALAAMTAVLVVMADNALVVHTAGQQTHFALPTVQRLMLGDNALTVLAGTEYQYPYLDIEKLDFLQQTVGDVNGDGNVDISDVNAVINMMLGKADQTDSADVNGDNNIDISDVNQVINIMLGKVTAPTASTTSDRMLVHRANGLADIFVVDSITDITFVEIAEANTTITLIDADDSSVRASVTKTDGTARYEVAIYPVSQTPDDIEAYVQANKKFSRKTNGTVEFVDLDPATPYVIASLSYDAYDLPCEVSTLEFTTDERVISENPQVGDYLYSDGSWSTELKPNKTPVAIVCSTTTTEADKALGYNNGYAIALKDAVKASWTVQADENESGVSLTDGQDMTDREGLTHSRTLMVNADNHPAAAAAAAYANTPYATSGWFLPAIGQWVESLVNLGGLDVNAMTRENGVATWDQTYAQTALTAINQRLAAVGEGNFAPLNQYYYWSSSERSVATAYYLYANASFNISLQTYYKDSQFMVRPFIAF